MTEPRIELWSNNNDSEFAISLTTEQGPSSKPSFVIKTDEKSSYSKKIDESVCMDGYTYDWKHTLAQWVHFHFGNQVVVNIPSPIPIVEHQREPPKEPEPKRTGFRKSYFKPPRLSKTIAKSKSKSKPRTGISQGVLKCHYCNLKYCLEEEREQHEEFWHSDKK